MLPLHNCRRTRMGVHLPRPIPDNRTLLGAYQLRVTASLSIQGAGTPEAKPRRECNCSYHRSTCGPVPTCYRDCSGPSRRIHRLVPSQYPNFGRQHRLGQKSIGRIVPPRKHCCYDSRQGVFSSWRALGPGGPFQQLVQGLCPCSRTFATDYLVKRSADQSPVRS